LKNKSPTGGVGSWFKIKREAISPPRNKINRDKVSPIKNLKIKRDMISPPKNFEKEKV